MELLITVTVASQRGAHSPAARAVATDIVAPLKDRRMSRR